MRPPFIMPLEAITIPGPSWALIAFDSAAVFAMRTNGEAIASATPAIFASVKSCSATCRRNTSVASTAIGESTQIGTSGRRPAAISVRNR